MKYNPDWALRRVKYDMRHWLANMFLVCSTKDTPLFKYFCVAVSDAVFMIIPTSREEVRAHLKFLGLSDDQIKRVWRKYWRSRARFVVPAPALLQRRLTDVYDFFCDLVDPSTGRSFFINDHAKRMKHEMTYGARGNLSDIPGVEMYVKVGTFASGLARWICLWSSSDLEGYHLHLAKVRYFRDNWPAGTCPLVFRHLFGIGRIRGRPFALVVCGIDRPNSESILVSLLLPTNCSCIV